MLIQSCLKSTPNTIQTHRRVRFAEPIAMAYQEPIIPGPRRCGPPLSAAQLARRSFDPKRRESVTTSCATPVMCLPHLPYARPAQLTQLAIEQQGGTFGLTSPGDKKVGQVGPLEALAEGLNVDLMGVVDAVEDSTLVRYGSYAAVTGGALVFVPVAAVILCSYAGLYAGYWGVKQLGQIGASSARAVLGLPAPDLARPASPPHGGALSDAPRDAWPTHTYLDDGNEEDF